MKLRNLFAMLATAALLASCSGNSNSNATNTDTTPAEEVTTEKTPAEGEELTLAADLESSNIRWEGSTAGAKVYSHFGNINLQEGTLTMVGDQITGGNFVIDMSTIDPKDDGYSDENTPEKLVGHLSTGDFFLVEEYPTASFKINEVNGNVVTGDLTIRGTTKTEQINLENVVNEENKVTATGKLVFNRQDYNVAWKHFLKDVVLADEIELDITLVANK